MKTRLALFLAAMLISSSALAQQFLPVGSIVNARDLGGYTVEDGRVVRDRVLIRAAHLADVSDEDVSYLAGIHVSKVIDFRKMEEKRGKADIRIPGAEYIVLPIDASGNASVKATDKEMKKIKRGKKFDVKKIIVYMAFNDKAKTVAREMYPTLFFNPDCQKQFAKFFRHVITAENGAVIYHCTQGKDRTGVASALLLAALGAGRETIVADFDATNRVYEADVRKYSRRVKFWGGNEEEIGVVKAFLGCNTDNFVKALERIDVEYGSIDSYLEIVLGVTAEDREILKARYLK